MNIISKHLNIEDISVVEKQESFNKINFFDVIFSLLEKRKIIHKAPIVAQAFEKKENDSSSGVGESIAIPHLRHNNIKTPFNSLYIFREGVDYNSFDGEPVKLVFLTLLPEKETFLSLAINSTILKFFKANPISNYLSITDEKKLKEKLYSDITSFSE